VTAAVRPAPVRTERSAARGGTPAAGRPGRPRSDELTGRIRATARGLFADRGFAAVPMSEIAAACGVGLDSIYRRWPSKQALLLDVVSAAVGEEIAVPDTGTLLADLQQLTVTLASSMSGDLGRLLTAAITEASTDPGLAIQLTAAQARRRGATQVVVARAVDRGELSASADGQLLLDLIAGLVWQRIWLAGTGTTPTDLEDAVATLLTGFTGRRQS
jgi:AcrR family transcriptional regulator